MFATQSTARVGRIATVLALAVLALAGTATSAGASMTTDQIGDVNGDGIRDYATIIVAPGTKYDGAWVQFGTPEGNVIQIPPRPGTGFRVQQAGASSTIQSLTNIGDFDGDGYDDLMLIADKIYVIYGKPSSTTVTAGADAGSTTLPNGIASETSKYATAAGDFDGDGLADVVMTRSKPAAFGWAGRISAAVVHGGPRVRSIDTTVLSSRITAINGAVICNAWGLCSEGLMLPQPIGDVNGDGKDDLMNLTRSTYVILGRAGSAQITGGTPDAQSIKLPGVDSSTPGGAFENDVIAPIGDVTGDGIDDIPILDSHVSPVTGRAAIPGVHTSGGISLSLDGAVALP